MSDAETAALLVRHAETLQASIEAQQAQIAKERQKIDALLTTLQGLPEKLGEDAFAGGRAAGSLFTEEVLNDASRAVTERVDILMERAKGDMAENLESLAAAKSSLLWSSAVTVAICCSLAALSAVIAIGMSWDEAHARLAAVKAEVAARQSRLDELEATLPDMERKAAELEAKGVNFQTTQCLLADHKTKRLCVEVDPDAGWFGDSERRFYIPKMPPPRLVEDARGSDRKR